MLAKVSHLNTPVGCPSSPRSITPPCRPVAKHGSLAIPLGGSKCYGSTDGFADMHGPEIVLASQQGAAMIGLSGTVMHAFACVLNTPQEGEVDVPCAGSRTLIKHIHASFAPQEAGWCWSRLPGAMQRCWPRLHGYPCAPPGSAHPCRTPVGGRKQRKAEEESWQVWSRIPRK